MISWWFYLITFVSLKNFYIMVKLNVDCCSVTAQDNEPRVTFTTRKFISTQEEMPIIVVVREHVPLSAAMQLIVTDRQLPDGTYEQYLIEPEDD
jgi:hypothetical protein